VGKKIFSVLNILYLDKICQRQGLVTPAYNPSSLGRFQFTTSSGKQFVRFHLQNNQSKMYWMCGSCGTVPALQV
jgi:hypothetical protein